MQLRYRWRAYRWCYGDERAELLAAKACCRRDSIAVDVGAHKDSYTYWLAKWCFRVVAFEPQPELATHLRVVIGANVVVENKGAYSRSGTLDLHRDRSTSPGASFVKASSGSIAVPVVALDEYFDDATPVSLLKTDVEGAEMEVFRGAERILTTKRPAVIFECERRHAIDRNAFDAIRFLERLGYAGYFFLKDEVLPISAFRPDVHQRTQLPYCNNFAFRNPSHGG
jgi:FkbM family methyltransferase